MPETPLEIVILAAGKGSRMKSALPKVLHQVAGKALLQHVIDAALELDPSNIHIVVGHGKELVQQAISNEGTDNKIHWIEQTEQLGTGHAVQQALPEITDDSNVLILYGDVPLISPTTLGQLSEAMTGFPLALLTAFFDDQTGYGRILHDENFEVCGIVEQKDASPEQREINEINTGIICARAKDLKGWLSQINNDNAQEEYYLTDIVELAYSAGNPISATHPQSNDEIIGINSRAELAHVERLKQRQFAEDLMAEGVTIIDPARVDIRGDVTIGTDTILDINCVISGTTTIGNNVRIMPNCVISNCYIGDNTTVHSHTVLEEATIGNNVNVGPFARIRPGTALADEVRIGNFVETKKAQLGEGSKVNHLSYVGDSTVGKNTNIGAGVITCNYDGANKHQTVIGDNVFVGSDSQLVAPVTIADGATIGAGSTITKDVEQNQLVISRAKSRHFDDWQRPVKKK